MYERSLEIYRTNLTIECYAKEQQKKAWAKGLAEGRAKGHAEGMEKGHAEGILETARKMKAMNMAVNIIAACTNLSTEEIKAL